MPWMNADCKRAGSPPTATRSGDLPVQLLEGDRDLATRQIGPPQTEVGTAAAKADVRVGMSLHVEGERVVELRVVPVGRPVHSVTLSPTARRTPLSSVSWVTVRRMYATGDAHRTTSSTAVGATAS